MYQLAIFDLDGTLLDTLADLRQGINYALGTQGFAPRSMAEVRAFVGNGIWKLVERAVPAGTSEAQMDAVYEAFNPYYAKHCADLTVPYDGILPLLQKLQAQGVVCALVSNKPDYAVQTLAAQYFPGLLAASAGAKDGVRKKPAPDSVFAVIHQLGAEGLRAVYIGDSEVDLQTAQNAALPCISVSWGFRDRSVLEQAGAACICDTVDALYSHQFHNLSDRFYHSFPVKAVVSATLPVTSHNVPGKVQDPRPPSSEGPGRNIPPGYPAHLNAHCFLQNFP